MKFGFGQSEKIIFMKSLPIEPTDWSNTSYAAEWHTRAIIRYYIFKSYIFSTFCQEIIVFHGSKTVKHKNDYQTTISNYRKLPAETKLNVGIERVIFIHKIAIQ